MTNLFICNIIKFDYINKEFLNKNLLLKKDFAQVIWVFSIKSTVKAFYLF